VGSQDNRGAPAGSRQRLGDVVVTYLRDNRAGSSGHQAPKIGCLNRADNRGYRYAQDLIAEGLEQTPMSLLVPLLEFNLFGGQWVKTREPICAPLRMPGKK
jgi:hypothetical protein